MRQRLSWRLLFFLAGLLLGAYLLRHALVPDPTILAITVIDAATGQCLPGAHIWIRPHSGLPLPTAVTDPTGQARFLDLPSEPDVDLGVQMAGYDLLTEPQVAVPPGQQTNLTLPLTPRAGDHLFVGLEDARIIGIDTASLLPLYTAVLPAAEGGPVTHLLLHPDEDRLYAIVGAEGFLVDSRTGATLAMLEIEPASGRDGLIQAWGLSQDGGRLLVLDVGAERVLTLEASTGRFLTASPLCRVRISSEEVQLLPKPQAAHWKVVRFAQEARTIVPLEQLVDQAPRCLPFWYDDRAVLSLDGRYVYTWLGPGREGSAGRLQEELRIRPIELSLTHWMTRSLPVGTSALATSPSREELYVLNDTLNTLGIVAPLGEARQVLVPVGEEPSALVVGAGGTRAYVANHESQTVSVVDLASAQVMHTIPLPGRPLSLALPPRASLISGAGPHAATDLH